MDKPSGSAWLAFLSALLAASLILVLHWLDPQYLPARHDLAQYMLGKYSWLMRAALVLLAVAAVSLAYTLVVNVPGSSRLGAFLLLLAAFGFLFASFFAPGPGGVATTLAEEVHSGGLGMAMFTAVLAGLAVSWRSFRASGGWPSFLVAVGLAAAWLWLQFAPEGLTGWPDRVFMAALTLWYAATAIFSGRP
ncbi:MAG: DUF998 domain-containing protein [Chloroflexi bacterium]|nr:DUF998 domain-containing protein [Chloroflexota bacterium]